MTEQQLLINACNIIAEYLKEEFITQGHSLSEAWENSVVAKEGGEDSAEIWATGYGMIINYGIEPERIPYAGNGSGSGGTSAYIKGLQRFWKLRRPGISDNAALKLAFATANVHVVEGLSTEGSREFSATGERQHFMNAIETLCQDESDDWVFTGLTVIIDEQADDEKVMYL